MDIFLKGEHSNMTGSFKERGEQTRNGEGGRGRGGKDKGDLACRGIAGVQARNLPRMVAGARNALLLLSPEQRERGVVAASAGNHGLALSYHGRALGIPVTVVMPGADPGPRMDGWREGGMDGWME